MNIIDTMCHNCYNTITFDIRKDDKQQIINHLQHFLDIHKKYRNCYAWNIVYNREQREKMNKQFRINNHNYIIIIDDNNQIEITVSFNANSCYIEYRAVIYYNDERKDIRIVKKLIKELESKE